LRRFYWGYDVFFFDRPMALAMADSAGPFAMGMPWWDYWVPAATVFARRRFQIVGRPLALHLVHPRGYDDGSTATFETAFAEFVVSAAAKWSDPLSSDLTGLVRLCREWLDRKNENKKDLLFSGQTFETFAESIAPWRRALLENIISLNGVETSVQPSSHPSSGTRHANPAFGNLDSRLRAGSALDGARHFESTGQREEAKRMFQTALDLIPSDFGALSDFGEFLCRFGDPLEACTVLERARAQRPASAKVLNDFAYALRAAGRREDAIANFRQALTADPEFLDAYYNLAITLFEAGQPNDALACLDAALMKWPSAADIVQLRQHFSARAR
jgi:tetratricopeptide (TPR) repeat protein